jgi:hypothetical protein
MTDFTIHEIDELFFILDEDGDSVTLHPFATLEEAQEFLSEIDL